MAFYFYYNYKNPKVKIHKGECGHCKQGTGSQINLHGEENGGWRGGYATYEDALNAGKPFAEKINIEITDCGKCKPSSN